MDNIDELTFDGYIFANKDDLEIACNEQKKIDFLNEKLDFNNVSMVHQVYDKALDNRSFATPVGLVFMHKLRTVLLEKGVPESDIKPVPLYTSFKRMDIKSPRKFTAEIKREMKYETKYKSLIGVVGVLVLVILLMFLLNFTSNNPNVLNYKRAVTNEYSEWEQNLREREAAVRAREIELKIGE